MKRITIVWVIAAVIAVLAGSAAADKATSLDHYGKGKRAYATGHFELAIEEFDRAYREFPAPEYLHDIAQALRRLDRCNEAVSYFERFLAERPAAPNRASIEAQIAALHARCPSSPAPSAVSAPVAGRGPAPDPAGVPDAAPAPDRAAVPATTSAQAPAPPPARPVDAAPTNYTPRTSAGEPIAPATVVTIAPRPLAPSRWSAGAMAGIVFLGAGPVVVPPIVQARISANYRAARELHVGAGFDLAPVPYDDRSKGTMWLGGPQLSIDSGYPINNRFSIVGGAGLGARLAWGLQMGNPFVEGGRESSAITMLVMRAEVGVAWRTTDRIAVRVMPIAFQYSPRRAPLASDIGSLRGFAMMIGLDVDL